MFEINLYDTDGTHLHYGTTYDFLDVLDRIASHFNPVAASGFVKHLLETLSDKSDSLRIGDWNCRYAFAPDDSTFNCNTVHVIKVF